MFWSEYLKYWKIPFIFVRCGWNFVQRHIRQFGWGSEFWRISIWSLFFELLKVFSQKLRFWVISLYNSLLTFFAWANFCSPVKFFILSFLGVIYGYMLRLRCLLGGHILKKNPTLKMSHITGGLRSKCGWGNLDK